MDPSWERMLRPDRFSCVEWLPSSALPDLTGVGLAPPSVRVFGQRYQVKGGIQSSQPLSSVQGMNRNRIIKLMVRRHFRHYGPDQRALSRDIRRDTVRLRRSQKFRESQSGGEP